MKIRPGPSSPAGCYDQGGHGLANGREAPLAEPPAIASCTNFKIQVGLVVEHMTWGFPVLLKGHTKPRPVNNARFDKLSAIWRRWAQVPEQRCLIPCRRFAEAVGETGRMTETWLSVKGERTFAWAGLWRSSAEWGDCYTGVMTDAAPELMAIHDRCPVILARREWREWLEAPLEDLRRFDRPWPARQMQIQATDRRWSRRG